MKSLLQNRTPVQLLWIIGASISLVSLSFGVLALPLWHQPEDRHLLLWGSFVALLLGLAADLTAEQDLKNGVRSERWPDTLLEGPKRFVTHRVFFVVVFLLFVAAFGVMIFPRHHFGMAWAFLYPVMSLSRVSSFLRRKPTSTDDSLLRLVERPKPLQSDHWGTPSRP